ncbi:hypothetical protein V8G61_07940 [Gaetbulibacter sp. M240]|uniref:hypothetical protein n=1 Tax=Gaetbulibacter sp. M240 TaxID=3126511 RepID=UPI00374F009F
MKNLVLLCLCLCTFVEGFSQVKKPESKDSLQPSEKIQVNKIYDEQGRLTQYDSIYSYSYSSSGKMNDSLKTVFETYFKNDTVFPEGFFDDFFKADSITGEFNHKAFFSDGLRTQQKEIKNIMKQVDSLQRMFLEDQGKSKTNVVPKTSK